MYHAKCVGQYCPEKCLKQGWRYAARTGWATDSTLRIECGENKIHIIVEKAKIILPWVYELHVAIFYLLTAHTNASNYVETSTLRLDTTATPIATASSKEPGESLRLEANPHSHKCGKRKSL